MSFGQIKITNFALRHFDPKAGVTKITDMSPEDFENELNNIVSNSIVTGSFASKEDLIKKLGFSIKDGYAPFCKLIAVPNFTNARVGSLPITIANHQYIRHGY